ncbi:uncharacterized protein LOC105210010 [Zeugodacus cucurbitae]|uniref:uncharacterized protein LOC105210010 n=1 Tax=Zeugodacus cucurbitae TaxID=28588 RepID=UPI00059681D2|nr:uncharacterized protein LOC105210010 [Zeugodacus cucurbitae]
MKYLVIFIAAFVCVQAHHLPYITVSGSWESSEEEYSIHLPATGQRPLSLPGVGIISRPLLQAVKVKVPRFVSPEIKQQIITQTLAARGISLQSLAAQTPTVGVANVAQTANELPRQQRQVATKGATASTGAAIIDTLAVSANPIETGKQTTIPITPEVPKLPIVPLIRELPTLPVEPVVPQLQIQPLATAVPDVVSATNAPAVVAVPV